MGETNTHQAVPLSADMEKGISYAPMAVGQERTEESSSRYYNPSLRFLMGISGIPLALFSFMLLLISPIMFAFMHDDPKTMEFPGNLSAAFACLVYLAIAAVFALYSWTLVSSAYRGVTVISIPRCCPCGNHNGIRWASDTCGILLLIPALLMLVAYIYGNV
mmetsp:Transcript_8753/g.16781  ORF Transcript_8753/g.16781 Transcript_8753/m.16781 type:complete len:162 (+) Transcript_8753:52-537(+)|eukprot:scaffold39144_cov191-Amphora_coffeaeformis.AAC.2